MLATLSTARCTMQSHKIEIRRISMSGMYAVGCDGRLVGNYGDAAQAVFAACEHVRMLSVFQHETPRASRRFVEAVESL